MNHGFDGNQWWIEYNQSNRAPGNIREESLLRAKELSANHDNLILSFSGGLDSQCMLLSFLEQGLAVDTAFMHLPGYNDNEYEQVKLCNHRWGIDTQIVSFDPLSVKEEIDHWSNVLDIPNKNSILHRKFVSLLPTNATVVQNLGPPSIYINPKTGNTYCFTGYYSLEISRRRAFDSLDRKGKTLFWDYDPEFLLSTLDDEIFKAGLTSYRYIDHVTGNKNSIDFDRWDYFIKPFMYGKYWGKDLIYFPKYSGFEKLDFIKQDIDYKLRNNSVVVPYEEFVNGLKTGAKRYYQNHNPNLRLSES